MQNNCKGLMINVGCVKVLSALMVEQKHVQTLMIMFIVNYVFRLIVRVCGLMLDCTSPLDVKSGERSLLFFNY